MKPGRVYSKRKLLRKQSPPNHNEDSDETSRSPPDADWHIDTPLTHDDQDENDPDPVPIYINEDQAVGHPILEGPQVC